MAEKVPKPTLTDPDNSFPERNIPQYIWGAIIAFVAIIIMGIIALITAVTGTV